MGTRRISREAALQFLYQEDFTISPEQQFGYDLAERFDLFCALFQVNKKGQITLGDWWASCWPSW